MPSQPKLQRWTDLLAALLRRHGPIDFETLRGEVAAYHAHTGSKATLLRMFERDKDELRALGVPIESVTDEANNLSRYRLASKHFYLPFLQLAYETKRPPGRPRGPGYQSLQVLAFEPDELDAIARAARRVAALGDPALAHEAQAALRKLAHDLAPLAEPAPAGELVAVEGAPSAELLEALGDALQRRKTVRFTYRSMQRDATESRTVDPWGLAFVSGHWYLIGRDHEADATRQFRVSRIRDAEVNGEREQSADYAIPGTFDLAAHAGSRQAWELGDAEAQAVTVRFVAESGVTMAAMRLGAPVAGEAALRRFQVRRTEPFVRWVLGFAGAARIESPPALAEEVCAMARQALARYAEAAR